MKKYDFLFFTFCFLLSAFSIANAIKVGGHLTEDTTWGPENNPYLVTENIYVDAGVTLTILPGTIIKLSGASCTSWQEFNQNFWFYGGDSVAKMFWVDGRIVAEGTEQDSITFTRITGDPDHCWGTIYVPEQADMCVFYHCKFEYSCAIGIYLGRVAVGAISFYNGLMISEKNLFINNASGVIGSLGTKEISIIDNSFCYDNNINSFVQNSLWQVNIQIRKPYENFQPALIANNECIGNYRIIAHTPYCIYNNISGNNSVGITCAVENEPGYFYKNNFFNCSTGILSNDETDDSLFIKNNNFIGGSYGVDIDYAYVDISDNYFEGCDIYSGIHNTGKAFNNISNNGNFRLPGYLEVSNNISFNGNYVGVEVSWRNISCQNNLTINNDYAIGSGGTVTYNNCVFIENEEINYFPISDNPIFRNCIIDFPLEYPLIDGGGNIWVDSLSADSLFVDWQNGDFHLIEGSLAIDAGFDTLGYYCPFDMDYNVRVWDGDGNGSAIIDIGPYEYNSPSFGGIEGYTYNPTNGDPVDYVLIKINNETGEFTFSNSIGNFQYKLPAGIYDIYAERVFYGDVVIEDIEVIDGEFTEVLIPMTTTLVGIDEQPFQPSEISDLNIYNYPNPVRNSTTISFTIPRDITEAELKIYNIKGQLVKQFKIQNLKLKINEVIWDTKDESGKPVANGIYLYKLSTDKKDIIKKMIIFR